MGASTKPDLFANVATLADPARLAALRRLNLLDSEVEEAFDRITRMAARQLKAPVCLVSLVDDRRQFFKSALGLGGPAAEARETPLSHSFCQHVVTSGAPLVVDNAPVTPLVCENLAIRDLGVKAYLGAPILSPEGYVLGSFCVIDSVPRHWSQAEIALVEEFAGLVNTEVALRAILVEKTTDAARQKAILDGTTFSVISTTPDGIIEMFNAGAERMLGYTSAEMVGQRTPALLHLSDEVVLRSAELSVQLGREIKPGFETFVALAKIGKVEECEWTYVRKDGSHLPVLLTVTALTNSTGQIVGFLGVAQDITLRKQLLKNLAVARDQALEASRNKSEFLATMSHEIRTPMNAVIGMAELLADTPLDAQQTQMVRTMVGGAENLLGIINDILDFSRIEAGRMRLDPVDFDFQKVVEETVALLTPRAQGKGLVLTCDFESVPGSQLLGDSGRIRQILTNLLGNAIKFTEKGSVGVHVRVAAETASRCRVFVSVSDTGVGIAPEAQGRLFQPFSQADGSTTRKFGGTGLGLAICRQLVELMGGEIGFQSAQGDGSVFWFEVELVRCGSAAHKAARKAPGAGGSQSGFAGISQSNPSFPAEVRFNGHGLRLLVVEDNPANQLVASILLQKLGFEVELVGDGECALSRLANGTFDVVLMDCQMPLMDGYEVTRRIRAGMVPGLDPQIPVIALTAYARAEDREKCLGAGMSDYVTKPIRGAELTAALARCGLSGAQTEPPPAVKMATLSPFSLEVFDEEFLEEARDLPGMTSASLISELLYSFFRDEPEWLERIEACVADQRADDLVGESHRFAGSAGSFGARRLRLQALEIERAARVKDWDRIRVGVAGLRDACQQVRTEVARRGLLAC